MRDPAGRGDRYGEAAVFGTKFAELVAGAVEEYGIGECIPGGDFNSPVEETIERRI